MPIIGNKKPRNTNITQNNNIFLRPNLSEARPMIGAKTKAENMDNAIITPVSVFRVAIETAGDNRP